MLALPDVTLLCADTLNPSLAARALARSCAGIRYGRALLLTDRDERPPGLPDAVEVRRIATLATRDDYSRLMLKGLRDHVETSHALVVQWDGYVVNPGSWTDAFLGVDYCGAPWPWGDENRRVGNGGFSLRSRRLIDALASPEVVLAGNEDETIGVHCRAWLEATHGIRFAPVDLASRFSFEVAYPAGKPFGFHGLFNFCRVMGEDEIAALAPAFPDTVARSPQLLSLMRNCAAMGLWRATQAIADRILAADALQAEARRHRDDARKALERGPAVGRNDPCPCGSGKRYKLCHGALPAAPSLQDDPDARTREGIAAQQAGRFDDAERAYVAALALAPEHPYASHFLGVLAMQRRDWSGALPRLERAAANRPEEPDFHGNLGLAYMAVDRLDDAVAAHRRAIALRRSAGAYTNLGLALLEQRNHREAIAAYDEALALDAAHPQARWNRGITRLALGDRGGWEDYEARTRLSELGAGRDVPASHAGRAAISPARRCSSMPSKALATCSRRCASSRSSPIAALACCCARRTGSRTLRVPRPASPTSFRSTRSRPAMAGYRSCRCRDCLASIRSARVPIRPTCSPTPTARRRSVRGSRATPRGCTSACRGPAIRRWRTTGDAACRSRRWRRF
jgi:tetratricopeptide (TPR) repeat protein